MAGKIHKIAFQDPDALLCGSYPPNDWINRTTYAWHKVTCLSCLKKRIDKDTARADTTNSEAFVKGMLDIGKRVREVIYRRADICIVCESPIETMCFQGTGVCCENCRKALLEEENHEANQSK